MKELKQIGICMDHSNAIMMEFSDDVIIQNYIDSGFSHEDKALSLSNSEKGMHNKEQGQQSGYYKSIGEAIQNYQEVLLFGPTNAKNELYNLLKADHSNDNRKIVIKDTDSMTENQRHAFVREFFK